MTSTNELCVPAGALAIDGTTPAPGDEVELQSVKGRVTRAEGDNIYIQPTEANGQPVTAPAKPQEEPVTEAGLRNMAQKFDSDGNGLVR